MPIKQRKVFTVVSLTTSVTEQHASLRSVVNCKQIARLGNQLKLTFEVDPNTDESECSFWVTPKRMKNVGFVGQIGLLKIYSNCVA